jgi:hypothetical protein
MAAWVQAALAALGMVADYVAGDKAAQAAGRAAEATGQAETEVTTERIRQLNLEQKRLEGSTIAATAGSNVKVGTGSPLEILAEQAREFTHEKFITSRVGATKTAQALQRGRDVGNAAKYQSYGNIAKGASNIFSMLSSSGEQSDGE